MYGGCVFLLQFVILDAFIGSGLIFCIYEHVLNMNFYIFEMSGSVNDVRTKCFLFAPPIPIPAVSQSSLPGGNDIENMFLLDVYDSYEKINTKMITSCKIRRDAVC